MDEQVKICVSCETEYTGTQCPLCGYGKEEQ